MTDNPPSTKSEYEEFTHDGGSRPGDGTAARILTRRQRPSVENSDRGWTLLRSVFHDILPGFLNRRQGFQDYFAFLDPSVLWRLRDVHNTSYEEQLAQSTALVPSVSRQRSASEDPSINAAGEDPKDSTPDVADDKDHVIQITSPAL